MGWNHGWPFLLLVDESRGYPQRTTNKVVPGIGPCSTFMEHRRVFLSASQSLMGRLGPPSALLIRLHSECQREKHPIPAFTHPTSGCCPVRRSPDPELVRGFREGECMPKRCAAGGAGETPMDPTRLMQTVLLLVAQQWLAPGSPEELAVLSQASALRCCVGGRRDLVYRNQDNRVPSSSSQTRYRRARRDGGLAVAVASRRGRVQPPGGFRLLGRFGQALGPSNAAAAAEV